MIPTLYLTRNGLLEPLGQSQVLAYLRGLSKKYQITLITYEKDEDRADAQRLAALASECERLGIRWLPQRFRPHPKLIAPAWSMFHMTWLVRREVRRQGAQLIHARSYIPAAVAMVVSWLSGVPFIFDMRALWPEELITAGRLRRGSLIHRAIANTERLCLARAAAVVSLTHAAVDYLSEVYPHEMARTKIVVIPTCADLNRFVPAENEPQRRVIGCLGTLLSGWFRLDWLKSFLSVAASRDPHASFELTTRDNPAKVRTGIDPHGHLGDRLRISQSLPEEVYRALQGQSASVMFYAGGQISELGRSPTRMAEILGCGLPIVANDGVGDVARIIRDYRVGVLVNSSDRESMDAAWSELTALMQDTGLSFRCRKAAEEVFSLDAGTAAYSRIYLQVIGRQPRCAG
jgi:glycosyltransferase involved in cell wall biosynthesis